MSLLIAGLAFEDSRGDYFGADRLGTLIGSLTSAITALLLLNLSLPKQAATD